MPNLSAVLKGEIARVARKELKASVDPLRKTNAYYRREIAELKRQVATLQKEVRTLSKPSRPTSPGAEAAPKTRFSAKGLKSLRARLGLSASEFGRLVGASGQSIYNWEAGKAVPRQSQRAAVAAVRGIGKREAAKKLEALA